jgi:hypothetical protein
MESVRALIRKGIKRSQSALIRFLKNLISWWRARSTIFDARTSDVSVRQTYPEGRLTHSNIRRLAGQEDAVAFGFGRLPGLLLWLRRRTVPPDRGFPFADGSIC